ncbi:MAG: thiamine pyrophosphate-dependent enzyme, partial [Gemmatimonadales bacterium]
GCVINLVGYRRHGHNEGDEPRFTQPTMYQLIDGHPTAREIYAKQLVAEGVVTDDEADRMASAVQEELVSKQEAVKRKAADAERGQEPDRISAAWVAIGDPDTAVEEPALRDLNHRLLEVPEGFAIHPKLKRQLDRRASTFDADKPSVDWGHAEGLALGSLLNEGIPIRFTGQDVGRGTFSHRHAVLTDAGNGSRYVPLQNLPDLQVPFEIHNSPLSEYAVLGFEYGYSVASPNALVLWEAQFGDFANGAEIVIDQFIIAGLAKWNQTSRLTLLLPHGYEGQGPEHSSARLERFLALGAEGNIRVANCSTPAQYFHLLRRQAKIDEIRPLIVMTPKSLLRLPMAASSLSDFTTGRFAHALDDDTLEGARGDVTRLVFCSGKVYYDVIGSGNRDTAPHVAIGRIEMLYPFPEIEVDRIVRSYPNLREVVWLQEEPGNMGARKWVVPKLHSLVPEDVAVRWITRPERSSPAEGYPAAHRAEQDRLVTETLA